MLLLVLLMGLVACNGGSSVGRQPTATPLPSAMAGQWQSYGQFMMRQDVVYGPLADMQTLDICLPVGIPGPYPGVVLIHGGAWSSGNKEHYDPSCGRLASQGFVAATINYRLAPAAPWPAQLVDAQLAVRWLRSQAGQLELDAQRICAWGDSAGAHLAVFLGVLATIHPGDMAGVLANQSPHVSCVVDAFGPVDMVQMAQTPHANVIRSLLGGATPESDPAIYQDASPILLVSPKSAPMLIIHGTQDTVVPPSQSQELQQALRQQHVSAQYISYDGGHEFVGLTSDQLQAIVSQIMAFLGAQEHV